MKLNVKALTITVAIFWGGAVLLVGLANLIWPDYGVAFLQLVASIYPGYHGPASFGSAVVATGYAVVDGGFGGLIFAVIYNRLADAGSDESCC
jgi:hypothetical protein